MLTSNVVRAPVLCRRPRAVLRTGRKTLAARGGGPPLRVQFRCEPERGRLFREREMRSKNKLIWVLAAGVALTIGGVAWWLLSRRKMAARGRPEAEVDAVPSPADDVSATGGDEGKSVGDLDFHEAESPAADPQNSEERVAGSRVTAEVASTDARTYGVSQLRDHDLAFVEARVRTTWPEREHGPALTLELGDDIAFIAEGACDHETGTLEVIFAQVESAEDDVLGVEILGGVRGKALGEPKLDHGFGVGDRVMLRRDRAIQVIKPKPPAVLVPENRRKRYRVGAGDLISLRPRKPISGACRWRVSRDDVELNILEEDDQRVLVALGGSPGEVNVALLVPDPKNELRPVCSWKFELVASAA